MKGLVAYNITVSPEDESKVKSLLKTLYLRQKKEFEERQEMRLPNVQLEPHIGKSIAHILANVRLLQDPKHRDAAEEFTKLLGL